MDIQATSQKTQNRPAAPLQFHTRLQIRKRKRNPARLPWWREPPIGYLMTLPLVGLGLLIPLGFQYYLKISNTFLGTPSVLVTLIIALVWGLEAAVFSIFLSTLVFDIYFLPQLSTSGTLFHSWAEVLQLVPFVLAEIIIVILVAQRERGRRQILSAQHELEVSADEFKRVNQELLAANQELEKANQLKDHFLSMASHELKTPITTIRGHAQLGMRRLATQANIPPELAPLSTAFERIEQQTFRLNNLVDDLLDLSILRSGQMAFNPTRCDLGAICREVIAEQQSLTGRKFELDAPSSPVMLQADAERLGQVVTNLVSNAVKYSPEDSAVQLRISQSNRTAKLQVRNQGPAIPPEHQANIFEPFYRAPSAQSSKKKGWGLGLAISKQIVERHSGSIRVKSSEGKGTTFTVELPVVSGGKDIKRTRELVSR